MNNQPLVSVIMNCYNSDQYLREAIDSVISQTYANWEIIFWDNQSTDNSAEIVKSYDDKRIKYFYAPTFEPLYGARNYAIGKSLGEYISFLDCDDTWMLNKLEKQVNVLIDLQYSFCYSNYYNLIKGKLEKAHTSTQPSGDIFKYQISNYTVGLLSVMFRKKVWNSMDEKFNKNYNYPGDFDFFIRVLEKYKAVYINDCLCTYRYDNPNSISNTKDKDNLNELKNLIVKYRQRYIDKDILLEIKKLEMQIVIKEADYYMKENMYSKARSILKPYMKISNKYKVYYFLSFFGLKTIDLLRYIKSKINNVRLKI